MFPPMTTSRPPKRSLSELVRQAVGTAVELATLGEASAPVRSAHPGPTAPGAERPRRLLTAAHLVRLLAERGPSRRREILQRLLALRALLRLANVLARRGTLLLGDHAV